MFLNSINSKIVPDKTIEKLLSFRNLQEGWDYGIGSPAHSDAVTHAIKIYNYFRFIGFSSDATPRTDGGVTLILYKGKHFIDITIHPNLALDIRKEIGIGLEYTVPVDERNVSLDRVKKTLNETYFQCTSLELSTSKNIQQVRGDSKATASVITEMGSQYSKQNVQRVHQVQSVPISRIFTLIQ